MKKISVCWPETKPLPLTEKGKQEVATAAKKLAKEKIDLIISSDILRTKETAQIIVGRRPAPKSFTIRDCANLNVRRYSTAKIQKLIGNISIQKNRF